MALRAPRAADEREFLRLLRLSRPLHHPWVNAPHTPARFRAWLKRNRSDDYEALLACRREDGAMVGVFNLSQIFRGHFQNAYLGWYAMAPHAGRGYMAEALGLVLRHAFRTLKLHRVEANIQPGNEASRRLAKRAGFRLEGFSPRYLKVDGAWRDHERWAITADEP